MQRVVFLRDYGRWPVHARAELADDVAARLVEAKIAIYADAPAKRRAAVTNPASRTAADSPSADQRPRVSFIS